MTEKQKRFADEYIVDLNATRAYKVAYPNIKNDEAAAVNASRMLRNAKVSDYIDAQLEQISSEKIADAQEVMNYLTAVMRGKTLSEVVVIEGCGEGYSSARRMDKAPDEKEKLKAAELLGKRYRLFTDNLQIDGSTTVQIFDDIPNKAGDADDKLKNTNS